MVPWKVAIDPLEETIRPAIQAKMDSRTKPMGSLGRLESLVMQIGLIQGSKDPCLKKPAMVVFAGDHGLCDEGISPYPSEVTCQMILNFLHGGAAINAFARQHGFDLWVVNAGTKEEVSLEGVPEAAKKKYKDLRVAAGTQNTKKEPAMTKAQFSQCLLHGAKEAAARKAEGCNVIGFGEMGIGNSSAAALITSLVTKAPLDSTICPGTGCDSEQLKRKYEVLGAVLGQYKNQLEGPMDALRCVGGFEMVAAAGAMLKACESKMVVLVDGYIMSAAALCVAKAYPQSLDYMVFCHSSASQGHKVILDSLKVKPLVDLSMRLGEGTGVCVAYPILESALCFYSEMASFESAAVSRAP